MGLNNEFRKLQKIDKNLFGAYLNIVEETFYETESLKEKLKERRKEIKKNDRNALLIFLLFTFVWIVIPVFLIIATIGENVILNTLYIVVLLAGIFLMPFQYRKKKQSAQLKDLKLQEIDFIHSFCMTYILNTINTFYNKEEVFVSPAKDLPEQKFEMLKNLVVDLEIDFTVYADIVYKSNRLNNEVTEVSEVEADQRDFSLNYLREYLK